MTSAEVDRVGVDREVPSSIADAFDERDPPIAVYGLGKIGAPLAAVLADEFERVIGVDVDPAVVDAIERGDSPVGGEPGLADLVETGVTEGSLSATTDGPGAATTARIHVVVVPTVLTDDREPDLDALRAALDDVAAGLAPGDLVAVESTLPPGTSREVIHPRLVTESGLDPEEVRVAFCPERTASGRAIADIRGSYPKVVGGVTEDAGTLAARLYERMTHNEVIQVSDARTAECVKVFEGVYRDVNIALANELALVRDELGIDVNEAITVANTQPYCDLHTPGAGVGGHCIPVYPYFLAESVESPVSLVETARSVNDRMPVFVVDRILQGLDERGIEPSDASVLLLGVAYRAGVAETRYAPAIEAAAQLQDAGVTVDAVDPVVDVVSVDGLEATEVTLEALRTSRPEYDGIVVTTAHEAFQSLDDALFEGAAVVDGRQFLAEDPPSDVYVVGTGPVEGQD